MATRRTIDDSDEEEATALDLRPQSRSAARPGSAHGQNLPASVPGPPRAPGKPQRPVVVDDQSEDEEATEFLQARPSSRSAPVDAVPRAQGRAVPIEVTDELPHAAAPMLSAPLPSQALPASMPPLHALPEPMHRPLPNRTIGGDISATGTASAPRVTRIQMIRDLSKTNGTASAEHETAGDEDDVTTPPDVVVMAPKPPRVSTKVDAHGDETQALLDPDDTQAPSQQAPLPSQSTSPEVQQISTVASGSDGTDPHAADIVDAAPRGLPNTAEGEPIPARPKRTDRPDRPDRQDRAERAPRPPAEQHVDLDGVLVIDAPPDATVTVNGVERGRGMVKVTELDRNAKHAVRIHCSGFAPWSGSVTLQGKAAAKIRPTLKPRR